LNRVGGAACGTHRFSQRVAFGIFSMATIAEWR